MKNKKQKPVTINKLFALIGSIIILISCLSNIFGFYNNLIFINDTIGVIYYLRLIILLGGGFIIGYLFTNNKEFYDKLYSGVVYATIANSFFWIFDIIRLPITNLNLPYPFSKLLFEGLPLFAIVATLIIAIIIKRKYKNISTNNPINLLIICSLIITQIYSIASNLYYLATGVASFDPYTPIWFTIFSYSTLPIVVALTFYIFTKNIKPKLTRLFYATLAASLYYSFVMALWELRLDADLNATVIFDSIVTLTSLIPIVTIIYKIKH